MATPNQMPKKPNQLRQQVVSQLIESRPASWTRKTLTKNEDGKETVKSEKVAQSELRFPLAQNMSWDSVERLAKRWI